MKFPSDVHCGSRHTRPPGHARSTTFSFTNGRASGVFSLALCVLILLPALCNDFRFFLYPTLREIDSCSQTILEIYFQIPGPLQHTKFATEHLKRTSSDWKK